MKNANEGDRERKIEGIYIINKFIVFLESYIYEFEKQLMDP